MKTWCRGLVSRKRHAERQSSDWRVVATKKNPIAARLGVLKLLPQLRALWLGGGVSGDGCRPVSPYGLKVRSLASQIKLNLSNATIWLAGVAARVADPAALDALLFV
jgi:hypothetical protein